MRKLIVCAIVIIAFAVVAADYPPPPELSDSKPSDETATKLVTKLKSEIFSKICDYAPDKCPASEDKIIVNSYKTQLVVGVYYFISANIGDDIYHIKIFTRPSTNYEEVIAVQGPKENADEISHF